MKRCIIYLMAMVVLVCGCATQRQTTHHQTHVFTADTLVKELQADTHVSTSTEQLDSIVKTMLQHYVSEAKTSEQQTETMTETITTALDSLGRELRTEQRTTTKTLSREEQQRQEQWRQEMEQQWQQMFDRQEAEINRLESMMQTHQNDSLVQNDEEIRQPAPSLPWYKRILYQILGLIVFVGIAA